MCNGNSDTRRSRQRSSHQSQPADRLLTPLLFACAPPILQTGAGQPIIVSTACSILPPNRWPRSAAETTSTIATVQRRTEATKNPEGWRKDPACLKCLRLAMSYLVEARVELPLGCLLRFLLRLFPLLLLFLLPPILTIYHTSVRGNTGRRNADGVMQFRIVMWIPF